MIDKIASLLFRWSSLREALFNEVRFYDALDAGIQDETPGAKFWQDQDGWRWWKYNETNNRYIFNDVPSRSAFETINEFDSEEENAIS